MSRFVLTLIGLIALCCVGCATIHPPAISDIREDVVKVEYEVPHGIHMPDSETLKRATATVETGSMDIMSAIDAALLADATVIAQTGCARYGDRVAEVVSTRCVRFQPGGLFEADICTHKEALFTCAPSGP